MYKSSADNRLKSGEIFLKISCQWRKNFMPVRFPFHASGRKKRMPSRFLLVAGQKKFTRRPVSK